MRIQQASEINFVCFYLISSVLSKISFYDNYFMIVFAWLGFSS